MTLASTTSDATSALQGYYIGVTAPCTRVQACDAIAARLLEVHPADARYARSRDRRLQSAGA